jgi:DNA-binding transcriptional LysR family regulator
MGRDLLSHLPVVLAVARHNGFASAAAELGMSPSAVSHAVRMVEDRLGALLFARTTRSVALTEAGTRLVASVEPALVDIGKVAESLSAERGEIVGLLRINAPRVVLELALTPVLAKLAWRHPELTVEIFVNDALVDIVAQGFDAGIRLGEAVQQDMIALRLTPPLKAILVASRSYLDAKGAPKTIADLHQHNCIGYRLGSGGILEWELMADHHDQDYGHGAGDGCGACARSRAGRRRHRLHFRAIGPPPYPRAAPGMAVAADGHGTGRALSVLLAPRFSGAKAARFHRRGEDGAQSVMTG